MKNFDCRYYECPDPGTIHIGVNGNPEFVGFITTNGMQTAPALLLTAADALCKNSENSCVRSAGTKPKSATCSASSLNDPRRAIPSRTAPSPTLPCL